MRDLSLHLLDLMENSIRAEATVISVTIEQDRARDLLRIVVEDNGPGLPVAAEQALDPFYTTKAGKRTGLGLSLFQGAAERAGGRVTLGRSPLGGLAVTACMRLSHLDRSPLGDIAASLSSVACTNPEIDLWCRLVHHANETPDSTPQIPDSAIREWVVRSSEVEEGLPFGQRCGLAVARRLAEKVREGMAAVEIVA
ncbi:MAG: sensor histidine kinase [Planctomycetes bacterium]|nr:sensor histidine kinase [Planctomycetota bacterium]